jgi:hypothetical protein
VDRARQTEKVLRSYAEHASEVGTCYPSVRRIMERTHYSETTVKRALIVLGELDYIRLPREFSAARRRQYDTFQISPYVMWITADHIAEAEVLWRSTSLRCNVIIHEQPTPESRIRTNTKNQNQEPASEPTPPPPPTGMSPTGETPKNRVETVQIEADTQPSVSLTSAKGAASSDLLKKLQNNGESHPDQSSRTASDPNPSPGSAAPPPQQRRSYLQFANPLPHHKQEQLAQYVKQMGSGTHIKVARALVVDYGYEVVRTARDYVEQELRYGRCTNPVGLLIAKLREAAVEPNETIGFDPRPQAS